MYSLADPSSSNITILERQRILFETIVVVVVLCRAARRTQTLNAPTYDMRRILSGDIQKRLSMRKGKVTLKMEIVRDHLHSTKADSVFARLNAIGSDHDAQPNANE